MFYNGVMQVILNQEIKFNSPIFGVTIRFITFANWMGKYKKIKAIFLLSVFSLITLQNAIPHIHHSHQDFDVLDLNHSELHGHDHHDHVEENCFSIDSFTFLHQLVEGHAHNSHSHEITQLNTTDSRIINISVFDVAINTTIAFWPDKLSTKVWSTYIYGEPLSPHSSGLTLRGPPFSSLS